MDDKDYEKMDKWKLINSLSIIPQTQSLQDRKVITAISKIFEELTESFEKVSDSNRKLSNRIFWLELIIALSTFIGVVISIIKFTKVP